MLLVKTLSSHKTFAVFLATIVLLEIAHGIELIALFPLYLREVMHEGADVIGVTLSAYLVADISEQCATCDDGEGHRDRFSVPPDEST